MIKKLSRKEEYFVEDEGAALDLIDDQRATEDGQFIIGQQMQEKVNKYGTYYRVVLEYRFNTPAGIMEVSDVENDNAQDEKKDDGEE
mgnify:CR=1 FL=1